ncbi:MAG: hypothetical protein DRJ52_04145 [Thermoprotei archaeon]|nr:MAG: hypothetical protein DRJ52_04145 [Thermoprotei archaeon]RLF00722.1 MAG: hypothetical protein DRJ63_01610 [Thermoprotei archaeon]HDI75084.1 ATP-binding protein [Thermoprotei archaeon]
MEIGRVVGVYGRNIVKISVPDALLPQVARPGVYVKMYGADRSTVLYGMVVGFNMLDELYRRARIIEELEGYEEFRPARNEMTVHISGYLSGEKVSKGVPILPKPGERVYLVSKEELQKIFNRGDVAIGVLSTCPEVEIKIDVNGMCTRHTAILAMTGAGKSNTVAVIIASLLKYFRRPRIIIIDTHSEYIPLARISDNVRVLAPKGKVADLIKAQYQVDPIPLEVPLWLLGVEEIYNILGLDPRATKQRLYLRQALKALRVERFKGEGYDLTADDPVHFTLEELRTAVIDVSGSSSSRIRDRSAEDLCLKIEDLSEERELYFMTRPEYLEQRFSEYIKDGDEVTASFQVYGDFARSLLDPGLNIMGLGGLSSEVQASIVSALLRALWRIAVEQRFRGERIATLVVLEEAHIYAPMTWSPSKQIVEKIAKEGRKFGVSLLVVSQRPRELSQTLLAQCGNLVALRTVNPSDQEHILRSMEDVTRDTVESLPGLQTGEALVSGPMLPLPALVKIFSFREVYNEELGGKDVNYREVWSSEELKELSIPTPPRHAIKVEDTKQKSLLDFN